MIPHSRPWLLYALIATMLLASTDGISIWSPEPARPLQAPTPEQALAKALERAAVGTEPDVAPVQTRLPQKTEASLSDEARRIQMNRLACVAEPAKPADLFAGKSWYVPPPPPKPKPPPPPPPPTAPPLPFSYMGSYQEPEGRLVIFLTMGDRLYTVSPGDVIDGTYRVEDVVAGQLGLTYLPLNIRQSMTIGEAS